MDRGQQLPVDNKLRGIALRDQIAAILREAAPMPVRTSYISSRLGTYNLIANRCGHPDICTNPSHWQDWGPRSYDSADIRPHLLTLMRRNLVEKHVPDPRRNQPHYYRWIGPDLDRLDEP